MGSVFFIITINLPQRFQVVNGLSPLSAGIRLLALSVVVPFGAGFSAQLIERFHLAPLFLLLAGGGLQILALALMTSLSVEALNVPVTIYVYQILLGLGLGSSLGAVILMTTITFQSRDLAVAMGSLAQFRTLGASILLSICTNLLTDRVNDDLAPDLQPAELRQLHDAAQTIEKFPPRVQVLARRVYAQVFRDQLYVMLAFSAMALLVTLLMVERKPRIATSR